MVWLENGFTEKMQDADETHPAAPSERNQKGQETNCSFPFRQGHGAKVVSPIRKGEAVEVLRMAPEDACSADMLVQIRWQSRTTAVPLSQLAAIASDESTEEGTADWHYWIARGHLF